VYGIGEITPTYFRAGVKIKPPIESSTCLTWLLLYFSVGQSVKKSE
jgi:hypothetical protein